MSESMNRPEPLDVAGIQAAVQESGAGWEAGETPLTALPLEERRLHLGYVPGPGEPALAQRESLARANYQAIRGTAALRAFGAPAAFDLRNVGGQNYITSVKNQGSCGSCVAFGAVATVEGTLRWRQGNANLAVDLSEAHLFYCHARAQGRTCGYPGDVNGGWWVPPALDAFKNPGVADDACYPYTAGNQNCTNLCSDWQSRVTRITSWTEINNATEMKNWLSTKGPLAACFTVYSDFYAYKSGVYRHVSGSLEGGHCVCCVGYDDSQSCWICKNSWGAGWGDAGFFRIGYGQVGIDAAMWGVDLAAAGWFYNRTVNATYAHHTSQWAWADIAGLGWRRIKNGAADGVTNMFIALCEARANGRQVHVYADSEFIYTMYLV